MPVGSELQEKLYICPGETRPISRAIHLSRLAAFFPACRACPFRTDTGQLPKTTIERLQLTEHRVQRPSLFTTEGVRGAYINEISRSVAGRMAAALARLLWQHSPLIGHAELVEQGHRRRRPAIVVGHDERPSSPDIVSGVVASLRRMGCQVIDISLATRPAFWFAVNHLEADAGILVTGSGTAPAWTGLDFCGPEGAPLSQTSVANPVGNAVPGVPQLDRNGGTPQRARNGGTPQRAFPTDGRTADQSQESYCESGERLSLDQVESQLKQPFSRSTRHAGPYRTFQAAVPYEASLWKHFHALRPLTIACACPSRLTRRTLERIFETLPCRLAMVDVPHRVRNPLDPGDADMIRLSEAVVAQQADLGILIDDDVQRCGFVDEQGQPVPASRMTQQICRLLLAEHPGETAALEHAAIDSIGPSVEQSGGSFVDAGETMSSMAEVMRDAQALVGGGTSGRLWSREAFPTSDAILTLAHVLALLSRSDAPLSEVAAGS